MSFDDGAACSSDELAGAALELDRSALELGAAASLELVTGSDDEALLSAEDGSDDPPKSHAWIIGIQGDLAVAVFVDEGEGGAATAGPILERFLRAIG